MKRSMLLVILCVIGLSAIDLHAAKKDGRWELIDLEGDRQALEGVVVQGVLRDAYHSTEFRISADGVSHETELFDTYQEEQRYVMLDSRIYGDYIYQVWNFVDQTLIQRRPLTNLNDDKSVLIKGYYSASDKHGNGRYGNLVEYGLADANGQMFYVTPTSIHYQGVNVIYRLNYEAEVPEAERLVELNMRSNDGEQSRGLEVIGLEASGDRLVLIMTEDQERLVVRSYDSESGDMLGETTVEQFHPAEHSTSYLAYADPQQQNIHLVFPRHEERLSDRESAWTILSFDLSDGIRLVEVVQPIFPDGTLEYWSSKIWSSIMAVHRAEDRLVVATALRQPPENLSLRPAYYYSPVRFMIYVYEAGSLIYRGELLTDVNDDFIYIYNLQPDVRYSPSINRNFVDIRVMRHE
jgi:hypothetical protein